MNLTRQLQIRCTSQRKKRKKQAQQSTNLRTYLKVQPCRSSTIQLSQIKVKKQQMKQITANPFRFWKMPSFRFSTNKAISVQPSQVSITIKLQGATRQRMQGYTHALTWVSLTQKSFLLYNLWMRKSMIQASKRSKQNRSSIARTKSIFSNSILLIILNTRRTNSWAIFTTSLCSRSYQAK